MACHSRQVTLPLHLGDDIMCYDKPYNKVEYESKDTLLNNDAINVLCDITIQKSMDIFFSIYSVPHSMNTVMRSHNFIFCLNS